MSDVLFLLVGGIFVAWLIPWGRRHYQYWKHSFEEWKEYEMYRISQISELQQQLAEWQAILVQIERGEAPYDKKDALTQLKLAREVISILQTELTRFEEDA